MTFRCIPAPISSASVPAGSPRPGGPGEQRLKAAAQRTDTEKVNTDNSVTTYARFPEGQQPPALRMTDNEAITEYQRLTVDLSDLEDFPWAYDENGVLYRCASCGLPFLADEWASMPRALDSHTFEWFGCPGTAERAEHDRYFHLHRKRRDLPTVV